MLWFGIRTLVSYVYALSHVPISISDCYGCSSNLIYKKMHTLKKTGYFFKTVCPANGRATENYRLILWASEPVGCAAKYILINHRIKRSMWALRSAALHQIQCIVRKQVNPQCSPQNAAVSQHAYPAWGIILVTNWEVTLQQQRPMASSFVCLFWLTKTLQSLHAIWHKCTYYDNKINLDSDRNYLFEPLCLPGFTISCFLRFF